MTILDAKVVKLNAELAKKILAKNNVNRNINTDRVGTYAKDMLNGLWKENGEPICVAEDGSLRNGQHRLAAVVKANYEYDAVLVTVSNDVFFFDRGRCRNLANSLQFADLNLVNYDKIGAAVKFYITSGKDYHYYQATDNDIIKHLEKEGQIWNDVYTAAHCGKSRIKATNRIVMAAFYYALKAGVDKEKLKQFALVFNTRLVTAEIGQVANTALACRNWFDNAALDKKVSSWDMEQMIEAFIERFVAGQSITKAPTKEFRGRYSKLFRGALYER